MRLLNWAYHQAAVVVAPSVAIAEDVHRRYGLAPSRVRVMHNPVDLARIQDLAASAPRRSDGTVVQLRALGRLVPQKGFDLLLEACRLLQRRLPRAFELQIAGDGPERRGLHEMAAQLGLEQHVRFVGVVANPYAFLHGADLFVMTSRWEGFPNALVEAMALSVPVVACRSTGTDEIVEHERSGLLCEPESPEALAAAMHRLLDDNELRVRCVGAGIARVQSYEAAHVSARYADLFRSVTPH
jgi:glycosyltransferase involved in cell wall biosynthesis